MRRTHGSQSRTEKKKKKKRTKEIWAIFNFSGITTARCSKRINKIRCSKVKHEEPAKPTKKKGRPWRGKISTGGLMRKREPGSRSSSSVPRRSATGTTWPQSGRESERIQGPKRKQSTPNQTSQRKLRGRRKVVDFNRKEVYSKD